MANLLESLQRLITPDLISRSSTQLGESEANTAKAYSGILPAVLGGLVNRTSEPGAVANIFNLIRQHGATTGNDPAAFTPGVTSPGASSFLSEIFGGKTDAVSNSLSTFAGIKASSVMALLGSVAPMILGFLNRKTTEENLDANGLGSYLSSQKSSIMSALPAGLGAVLGFGSFGTPDPVMASRPIENARPVTNVNTNTTTGSHHTTPPPKKNNWLWPLLLGLAALALLFFGLRSCDNEDNDTDVVATETTTTTDEMVTSDTAANAGANANALNRKELPGGKVLNIPATGIESQLVAFIEDNNRAVDKTTWFTFDRLNFETGSDRISQDSQEQINNMAEILKAYPNVELKIGGYTDNVGKPASNLKLSQDRAIAVENALVALGIDSKRLDAEGYGEQHPVAENTTDEGRARNRRIDVRVTKK